MTDTLSLKGLRAAPSQVCGAFRLVPLIRESVCSDVHMYLDKYEEELSQVKLDENTSYWSFIPHGLILEWGQNSPGVSLGAQLKKGRPVKQKLKWATVNYFEKMVKSIGPSSLRLLPMHLSMEYFLGLCFGGPNFDWPEYSEYAKRYGLGFRIEFSVGGRSLYLFDQALRQFEINEGQVGVLIYVAEELASAFVVPTPGAYRRLHQSLLEDFYGELLYYYACSYKAQKLPMDFDFSEAKNLADLRKGLLNARADWAEFSTRGMAGHLIDRSIQTHLIYEAGKLKLERFMTELDLNSTNTIGERLVRDDGEVLYLKTYRLERDQTRRAWWLQNLARHDWHLRNTARALNLEFSALLDGLEASGFGYLLKNQHYQRK